MSTAIPRRRYIPVVLAALALGSALAQSIEDADLAAYRTYDGMRKSRPADAERFLALHWTLRDQRDYALLTRLRSLTQKDDESVRREITSLVGSDYLNLATSMRSGDAVQLAAFSPDGASIVLQQFDVLRTFQAATGDPIGAPIPLKDKISALAVAPDGAVVAAGSTGAASVLRRADNGAQVGAAMPAIDRIVAMAFSPDGKSVLIADGHDDVRLWQLDGAVPIGAPVHFEDGVAALAFREDGKSVAAASAAGTMRTWRPDQGTPSAPIPIPSWALALNFHGSTGRLATRGLDSVTRLWTVHDGVPDEPAFRHPSAVVVAEVRPGGVLFTLSEHQARLWTGPDSPRLLGDAADGAFFSPDGRTIFTYARNTGRLWHADDFTPIGAPMQTENQIGLAIFSPDGKTIFTAGEGEGRLWRADTGAAIGRPINLKTEIRSVAFSPDGRMVITGCEDGIARMWRTDTGAPAGVTFRHGEQVDEVGISPDGNTVITATGEDKSRLWRTTGQPVAVIPFIGPIVDVAFSPDSKTVLLATLGGSRLFRTDNGAAAGDRFVPDNPVKSAMFSPDGSRVLLRNDNWLYLWEPLGAALVGAVYLPGVAPGDPRFLDPAGRRLELVTVDPTGRLATIRTVDFDHRNDAPIAGDAAQLLEQWKRKLGLTFDPQGRIVPWR